MNAQTLTLSDGRTMAYAQYGISDGIPVVYCHGTPGSHLLPEPEIAIAEQVGLRLIVPVRPGYGLSDFQPGRTLLDWPDDVVALAEFLDIAKFGIIGFSGGGPHAAACAYKIPEHLTKVILVSSLAPFEFLGEQPTPMTTERREYKAELVQSDPDAFFDPIVSNMHEPDRTHLMQIKTWFIDNVKEAYRSGVQGTVHEDTFLLTKSWGFPLEEISANVYIWQGEADGNVQAKHGRYLAEHIPNSIANFRADVGHLMPESELVEIFRTFSSVE